MVPTYMRDGYYDLGEGKGILYLMISGGMLPLLLISRLSLKKKLSDLCDSQMILIAMLLSNTLSFIFAVDHKVAFCGLEGWRTGFSTVMLMIVYALFFSDFRFFSRELTGIIMLLPFFEFLIAIFNRFNIFPIDIAGNNPSFLGSIGNINWFSGYLSVFVPIGMGIMYSEKRLKWLTLEGLYTTAGLMAILLQGSNGAALIIMASFGLLLWMAIGDDKRDNFKRFLIVLGTLGISMTIVDILFVFAKSAYTYEDSIMTIACQLHIGEIILAATFFLYALVRFLDEIKVPHKGKALRRIILSMYVVLGVVGAVFLVLKFDDHFGNGRGIIWRMSLDMFLTLSPWRKVVGVGHDCFYPYACQDAMWSNSFNNIFGAYILTNAHMEPLTILIECGFIGLVLYLALFIFVLRDLIKMHKKKRTAMIYALPIFSYLVYGLVSFPQITSTPYMYLCIGLAISFLKRNAGNA